MNQSMEKTKLHKYNQKQSSSKMHLTLNSTVEPRYNEGPWDHENYLVISGFSLYQGKKTKKYKELGPAKLPCYKRVLLYQKHSLVVKRISHLTVVTIYVKLQNIKPHSLLHVKRR